MKKFKERWPKIIILLITVISILANAYLFILLKSKPLNVVTQNMVGVKSHYIFEEELINKFLDGKCEYTSNVGWTECVIVQLDRVAAEREWKQRKLETIKHPEINEYNFIGILQDRQIKITGWRENFEKARNVWCEAKYALQDGGSGTPSALAGCELEIELLAVRDLNYIYYNDIIKNIPYSTGILDFEPSEVDIVKLVVENKTQRGCIWAGEENCD